MSVSWELVGVERGCIPRRAVVLKHNCGVKFGASGVLDIIGLISLGGGLGSCGLEGGGGGLVFFQSMPARLLYWL